MTTPPCTWSMQTRICKIYLCPILNLFRIDPFSGCSWNDETLKAYAYYLICYIYPTTIKCDTVISTLYLHFIFLVWSTARLREKLIQKLYKSQSIPGNLLKSPNFQQKSSIFSYWEMQIKMNFDKSPILKRLKERAWNLDFYISVRYFS